jgi:hypothetical protein
MIVTQTISWRILCKNFASRRTGSQARGARSSFQHPSARRARNEATHSIGANGNRCFTKKPVTILSLIPHRRSFSKFSTDEIVIQDDDASTSQPPAKCSTAGAPTATAAASKIKLSTAIPEVLAPSQSKKIHVLNNDHLIFDLQRAQEFFHQLYNESKALLENYKTATTSEEVVAMTNYFMILVNSLDLEKYLDIVQSIQNYYAETNEQQDHTNLMKGGGGGEGGNKALEESLRLAVKSMSQLHNVFLKMVELSLPPLNSALLEMGSEEYSNTVPSLQLHSAKTVRRALQLSRRAEELGLPLHRPMYQQLAVGMVLMSYPKYSTLMSSASEHEPNSDLRKHKVVINKPPELTLLLMEILANARLSFQIHTEEELVQLAEDILAEPVLLLLKLKQVEEAMDLLRAWQGIFGHASNGIDVLSLLGESHTLKALETVQGYTADTKFMEAVQSDPHVMELTTLLEVALEEILKGRKKRVKKISEMLWQLSLRNETDDDYDDNNNDSDSDFGDEFEYESDSSDEDDEDDEEFDTLSTISAKEFTPSGSTTVSFEITDMSDKVQAVESYPANALPHREEKDGEHTDNENFTILSGLSNTEARKSIYLRNGKDWVLPDIVSQLEDWNKGNRLTFTPMFEQYIGNQIAQEADDDDDYDDDFY